MLVLVVAAFLACGVATMPTCWGDTPMSKDRIVELLGGPGKVGPVILNPAM